MPNPRAYTGVHVPSSLPCLTPTAPCPPCLTLRSLARIDLGLEPYRHTSILISVLQAAASPIRLRLLVTSSCFSTFSACLFACSLYQSYQEPSTVFPSSFPLPSLPLPYFLIICPRSSFVHFRPCFSGHHIRSQRTCPLRSRAAPFLSQHKDNPTQANTASPPLIPSVAKLNRQHINWCTPTLTTSTLRQSPSDLPHHSLLQLHSARPQAFPTAFLHFQHVLPTR